MSQLNKLVVVSSVMTAEPVPALAVAGTVSEPSNDAYRSTIAALAGIEAKKQVQREMTPNKLDFFMVIAP